VAVWREKTAKHESDPTPAFPADLHRIAMICFDRDEKVCSVNAPFTQLTDYTISDIPSLYNWKAKLDDLSASLSDKLDTANLLNRNAALQKNLKIIRTKEGKSLIVEESHFFDGIHHFWTYLDMTDHWQVVEELEKQKQYIESIFSALPDLLFIIDREGRFIETKSGQLDNLAIPLEQFAHKKISEVLPNPFADRLMASIDQCNADREPTAIQYDLPINGVIKDFEARIAPFGSDRVVVLARDISASKDTERSLKKTKEFLEQAGKMAQVGAFEYFPATRQLNWSAATREIHEVPDNFVETIEKALNFFSSTSAGGTARKALDEALTSGKNADFEASLLTFSRKKKWVRVIINSEFDEGKCTRI
jgi:PAS domain-containing protein